MTTKYYFFFLPLVFPSSMEGDLQRLCFLQNRRALKNIITDEEHLAGTSEDAALFGEQHSLLKENLTLQICR